MGAGSFIAIRDLSEMLTSMGIISGRETQFELLRAMMRDDECGLYVKTSEVSSCETRSPQLCVDVAAHHR